MLTKKDLAALKKIFDEKFNQLNQSIEHLNDKMDRNHVSLARIEHKIDLMYEQVKREKVPPQLKRKEIRC